MKNLSLVAMAIVALVVLGAIGMINHWINSQMQESPAPPTYTQRASGAMPQNEKPHLPVIDPAHDPLAPTAVQRQAPAPVKPKVEPHKAYEAPETGGNLAG